MPTEAEEQFGSCAIAALKFVAFAVISVIFGSGLVFGVYIVGFVNSL